MLMMTWRFAMKEYQKEWENHGWGSGGRGWWVGMKFLSAVRKLLARLVCSINPRPCCGTTSFLQVVEVLPSVFFGASSGSTAGWRYSEKWRLGMSAVGQWGSWGATAILPWWQPLSAKALFPCQLFFYLAASSFYTIMLAYFITTVRPQLCSLKAIFSRKIAVGAMRIHDYGFYFLVWVIACLGSGFDYQRCSGKWELQRFWKVWNLSCKLSECDRHWQEPWLPSSPV